MHRSVVILVRKQKLCVLCDGPFYARLSGLGRCSIRQSAKRDSLKGDGSAYCDVCLAFRELLHVVCLELPNYLLHQVTFIA